MQMGSGKVSAPFLFYFWLAWVQGSAKTVENNRLFCAIIFLAVLLVDLRGEGVTLISEFSVRAHGISLCSRGSHCTALAGGW